MPGPAPKHPSVRARRNNPKANFRTLDPEARIGKDTPPWPLADDLRTAELELTRDRIARTQAELAECTDGRSKGRLRKTLNQLEMSAATLELQLEQARDMEVSLWDALWMMPQADMWEESHAGREVAQYVRWKIRGEQGDLDAAKEARMLSDRLGLNPLALIRLRAEIERANEAEDRGRRRRGAQPKPEEGKPGAAESRDPRGGLFDAS